ncbi:MAG: hypothetical protein CMI32_07945 [Opitutales bacterium]|nr:hypothetical protein [Opitutales bacterium]
MVGKNGFKAQANAPSLERFASFQRLEPVQVDRWRGFVFIGQIHIGKRDSELPCVVMILLFLLSAQVRARERKYKSNEVFYVHGFVAMQNTPLNASPLR